MEYAAWQLQVFPAEEQLAPAVAARISAMAEISVRERQAFHFVVTGGRSVTKIYDQLVTVPNCWRKWHIYLSDERCLPVGHIERNDEMLRKHFGAKIPLPMSQWNMIPAEFGLVEGVAAYRDVIARAPRFDLVMLSLGEDGHLASVFQNAHCNGDEDIVAVTNSPKPPAERISLTLDRIGESREIIILAVGSAKRRALKEINSTQSIVGRLAKRHPNLWVFADQDATESP